jgi:predicted CXXCH cytochrome family protein
LKRLLGATLALLPGLATLPTGAQQTGVSATLHNLSASGPGEIHAQSETEVCKFCHIPHAAVVQPLWGHALSTAERYQVATLRRGRVSAEAPQPDGSSRLCLSCHDGTVALGEVRRGTTRIAMSGSQRLEPGRSGHIGIDLSGSHPVSFVVPDVDAAAGAGSDMTLRPLALVNADKDVKLDGEGKMQCTTCHDPHQDRYYRPGSVPRFWVKPTVGEVCLACHQVR